MVYQNDTSEEYTCKILKELCKRDEYIIATKLAPKGTYPEKESMSVHGYVEECLTASMKRLQVDYIDFYILHWWDYKNPISEYLEAFHIFIQEGKIQIHRLFQLLCMSTSESQRFSTRKKKIEPIHFCTKSL